MKSSECKALIANTKIINNISFQKYFETKQDLALPFLKVEFGSTFFKGRFPKGRIWLYLF
jgi:hypothetical protein